MNSVLQCLFSLPPFKQSLKSIRESVSSAVQNEPDLLDNLSILRAITDLMADREKGQMSHIEEKVRYLQAEFQKVRKLSKKKSVSNPRKLIIFPSYL